MLVGHGLGPARLCGSILHSGLGGDRLAIRGKGPAEAWENELVGGTGRVVAANRAKRVNPDPKAGGSGEQNARKGTATLSNVLSALS
jgi:hypothetical protein